MDERRKQELNRLVEACGHTDNSDLEAEKTAAIAELLAEIGELEAEKNEVSAELEDLKAICSLRAGDYGGQ